MFPYLSSNALKTGFSLLLSSSIPTLSATAHAETALATLGVAATQTSTDAGALVDPPADAAPSDAELAGKIESLAEQTSALQSVVDGLAKLKVTGYLQARYEHRQDSAEGLSAAGKPTNTDMFLVRRGRLKTTYAGTYAEFMLQIDATGKGVVLKDAEATLIEPWTGLNLRLTGGQFKWPFGYEVLQSSGSREMPERTRVIRALFPGERDRGVRLQASYSSFRFSGALVNGNGIEDSIYTANDQNQFKDLVGRLGVDLHWLVVGVSGYYGKALKTTVGDAKATPPTTTTYSKLTKSRLGADLQLYVDVPVLGGLALKGEVIGGKENGANALGFWALVLQNVGDAFGVFVRYDRYDPDTDKEDNVISTIAGGVQYFVSSNFKATATYEHVTSQVASGMSDPEDDVLTLQLQAMF